MYTSVHQARGIDVQQVSLVINYDLPTNRENYIHRQVLSTTILEIFLCPKVNSELVILSILTDYFV